MKKVRAYRNLHRQCWSILGSSGRILFRAPYLWMTECEFIVRPGGNRKANETKRKNVHAFVSGFLSGKLPPFTGELTPITYNPYSAAHFVRLDTGEPIHSAQLVVLDADGKAYAKLS